MVENIYHLWQTIFLYLLLMKNKEASLPLISKCGIPAVCNLKLCSKSSWTSIILETIYHVLLVILFVKFPHHTLAYQSMLGIKLVTHYWNIQISNKCLIIDMWLKNKPIWQLTIYLKIIGLFPSRTIEEGRVTNKPSIMP